MFAFAEHDGDNISAGIRGAAVVVRAQRVRTILVRAGAGGGDGAVDPRTRSAARQAARRPRFARAYRRPPLLPSEPFLRFSEKIIFTGVNGHTESASIVPRHEDVRGNAAVVAGASEGRAIGYAIEPLNSPLNSSKAFGQSDDRLRR